LSRKTLAAIPGAHLSDRLWSVGALLSNTPHVYTPERSVQSYRVYRVETLQDARDVALLYLAVLAAEARQSPQFLARLETVAATWPRSERVLAWAVVENPRGLLREITAAANEPRDPALDRLCRGVIQELVRLPLEPELHAQAVAAVAQF